MTRMPAALRGTDRIAPLLVAAVLGACSPDERTAVGDEAAVRRDSVERRITEYEQQRTRQCEQRYRAEATRYSNVVAWTYDREVDGCFIEYRHVPPVPPAYCDSMYPPGEPTWLDQRLLCHEGRYRNRF